LGAALDPAEDEVIAGLQVVALELIQAVHALLSRLYQAYLHALVEGSIAINNHKESYVVTMACGVTVISIIGA
jgi:hypothetical protein